MNKISVKVNLVVTKTELYDFSVEVEVPDSYYKKESEQELEDFIHEKARDLAEENYWNDDCTPYNTETDDLIIETEIWD